MSSLVLLGWLLATPPPLAEVASEGSIGWLEFPRLSKTLVALERANKHGLLAAVLRRKEREALQRSGDTRLLWVWYPSDPQASQPDLLLMIHAGAPMTRLEAGMAAGWRQLGFREASKATAGSIHLRHLSHRDGREMTLFRTPTRVGWGSVASRARAALTPSATPLADSSGYVRAVREAPDADVRGIFDAQTYYGALALRRNAMHVSGVLVRLGLDHLGETIFEVRVSSKKRLEAVGRMRLQGPRTGLLQALSPTKVTPPELPENAVAMLWVSVRPARLLHVLTRVWAFSDPLRYTLVWGQLGVAEQRVGKRLAQDILGDEPQVWTLAYRATRRGLQAVLSAPLKDGEALDALIAQLAEAVPVMAPGVALRSAQGGTLRQWTFRGGIVAVARPQELVLASSREALGAYLDPQQRSPTRPVEPREPTLGCLQVRPRQWLQPGGRVAAHSGGAAWLLPGQGPASSAMALLSRLGRELSGKASACLAPTADGYEARVVFR